jgi:YD repeat-containing protein
MAGGPGIQPGAALLAVGACAAGVIAPGPATGDAVDACEEGVFPGDSTGCAAGPCQTALNAQSGNLVARLSLPAAGPGVYLPNLTYNAQVAEAGTVGFGWTMNVTPVLTDNVNTVTLKKQTGNCRVYTLDQGSYHPPAGVDNTLVKNQDNTWTETQKNGRQFHYDTAGRLTKMVDRLGNITTCAYDANNRLKTLTDPFGQVTSLTYDANGRVEKFTDPAGRDTSLGYDANGNLTSLTTPELCQTQFTYDALHRMTAVEDPRGYRTSHTYDGNNRVTKIEDALNGVQTVSYDSATQRTVTDPGGNAWIYRLNAAGNLAAVQNPAGESTSYTWDSNRLTAVEGAGRLPHHARLRQRRQPHSHP